MENEKWFQAVCNPEFQTEIGEVWKNTHGIVEHVLKSHLCMIHPLSTIHSNRIPTAILNCLTKLVLIFLWYHRRIRQPVR